VNFFAQSVIFRLLTHYCQITVNFNYFVLHFIALRLTQMPNITVSIHKTPKNGRYIFRARLTFLKNFGNKKCLIHWRSHFFHPKMFDNHRIAILNMNCGFNRQTGVFQEIWPIRLLAVSLDYCHLTVTLLSNRLDYWLREKIHRGVYKGVLNWRVGGGKKSEILNGDPPPR